MPILSLVALLTTWSSRFNLSTPSMRSVFASGAPRLPRMAVPTLKPRRCWRRCLSTMILPPASLPATSSLKLLSDTFFSVCCVSSILLRSSACKTPPLRLLLPRTRRPANVARLFKLRKRPSRRPRLFVPVSLCEVSCEHTRMIQMMMSQPMTRSKSLR